MYRPGSGGLGRMTGRLALLTIAALLGLAIACGSSQQSGPLEGEALEAEARSIDKLLICPQCPGQTIDQTQVALARDMRQVVREKLAEGLTRSEILDYFSDPDRYGPAVLASPPQKGFNLVVWTLPFVALVGGFLILFLVVRAMRRRTTSSPGEEVADLEPYLALVDRDLGLGGDRGSASPEGSSLSSTSIKKGPLRDG